MLCAVPAETSRTGVEEAPSDPPPSKVGLWGKFLSVPLTSAEIERLFSGTGKLITPDRCRLSADRASEITFLKENIIKPLYK